MLTVKPTERHGKVLSSSGLACLADVATVNMTAGCAHGCVYCYAQGYRQSPGHETVLVYRDTAARVAAELPRKRRKPGVAYFSPSCDAFQPIELLLRETFETIRVLLEAGVAIEFATKGAIPDCFCDLFRRHVGQVSAQIGLTTLDESLQAVLEPGAAPIEERLRGIQRLRDAGVAVAVRADPLIAGVTDLNEDIARLMVEVGKLGICDIAASYLFLRPAITAALKRRVSDRTLVDRILGSYRNGCRFTLRGGAGGGVALPIAVRRKAFERLSQLGAVNGIAVHVCGCKNPDLGDSRCHLVRGEGGRQTSRRSSPVNRTLWDPPPSY